MARFPFVVVVCYERLETHIRLKPLSSSLGAMSPALTLRGDMTLIWERIKKKKTYEVSNEQGHGRQGQIFKPFFAVSNASWENMMGGQLV
jgi:hypothetical protein